MIKFKHIFAFSLLSTLSSCDAHLRLFYQVQNKSDEPVQIHVPQYTKHYLNSAIDTVITLQPEENITIAERVEIGLPNTVKKRIYEKHPGVCGLEQIKSDTTLKLSCKEDNWKYKRRNSILVIE